MAKAWEYQVCGSERARHTLSSTFQFQCTPNIHLRILFFSYANLSYRICRLPPFLSTSLASSKRLFIFLHLKDFKCLLSAYESAKISPGGIGGLFFYAGFPHQWPRMESHQINRRRGQFLSALYEIKPEGKEIKATLERVFLSVFDIQPNGVWVWLGSAGLQELCCTYCLSHTGETRGRQQGVYIYVYM